MTDTLNYDKVMITLAQMAKEGRLYNGMNDFMLIVKKHETNIIQYLAIEGEMSLQYVDQFASDNRAIVRLGFMYNGDLFDDFITWLCDNWHFRNINDKVLNILVLSDLTPEQIVEAYRSNLYD